MSGYMNKQNMYVEHQHYIMKTPLHPEKCTVCCVLSTNSIARPMLFSDTVIADHYLHVLQ
jgi:hypothetical protein